MMLRRPGARALIVAAALLAPARARAQIADAAAARLHFERGVAFGHRARWAEAVTEFEAAQALGATAPVHYNLGVACRMLRRYTCAISAFDAFVAEAGRVADPAQLADVRAMIASMRRSLGTLVVRVTPAGAYVSIDGAPPAPDLAARAVDPGAHQVRAAAPGYHAVARVVQVEPGRAYELELGLVREDDGARLHVESNVPGAAIRLDGALLGAGAVEDFVRPGPHSIEVSARGYSTFRRDVLLLARGSERVRAVLADRRPVVTNPWFWVVAGSVVAGGVVAAVAIAAQPHEPLFHGPLPNIEVASTSR